MSILIEAKRAEARHALLESLDNSNRSSFLVWEGVGKYLREAALSPQQIQGLFGEIEKTATAGGSNRTAIGKGKDKVDQVIMKPWNDLKAKIYNSGPMEGFAGKYEEAAEKLKASAGGDEGKVMQIVKKYRQFAEKHPIMQGFIYAALIAAAGVSGAGLGGAAALGLFKLTDQLLQGKDIRSALYTAGKTGALAAGASSLGDLIKGGEAVQQALPSGVEDVVADFVPGEALSADEMNAILDLNSTEGIPQNVIDQYNSQLDAHVNSLPDGGMNVDADTAQDMKDAGVDVVAGERVEVLDSPVRGDVQTAETPEQLIQDGDKIDRRLSKGSVKTYIDAENTGGGVSAKYTITTDADGNYVKTYTRPLGGGGGAEIDIDDVSGSSGQDYSQNAQAGDIQGEINSEIADMQRQADLVAPANYDELDFREKGVTDFNADPDSVQTPADKMAARRAELQAKADLVAPGGTGQGIVVRGNIPITDPDQIAQFNQQFPGTEAMSSEATEWLKANVDGAAEKFDAKAAERAAKIAARKARLSQSGHSLRTNVLSEDQVAKLFVAIAYRNSKYLMEAPGLLQRAKAQISKGVTAAAGKAKQIGTNITTKVTADKLMKAWTKAGKPTDSVQVAQFLTNFGVDGAVLQQSYQTANLKMPDLKKIASNDPVMALVQKINATPTIKKQVIAYLNAVT